MATVETPTQQDERGAIALVCGQVFLAMQDAPLCISVA